MNFRSTTIIVFISLFLCNWVSGQFYLNFQDAYNASPLCDLSLIHTRRFVNPTFVETKGDLKCGMGGKEDNIIIFPFIATATSISISITGQSCTNPSTLTGLQAGIMQDTSGTFCQSFYPNLFVVGTTADFVLNANNFIPGNKYYLWFDGNGGARCGFNINVTQGNGAAPTLKNIAASQNILNGIIGNGIFTDTISFCLGPDTLKMEIPADGLDLEYQWILDPGPNSTLVDTIIFTNNKLELFYEKLGTYNIKVIATNGCTFTDTMRMTVIVTDLPPVEIFPDLVLCPEYASFLGDTLRLYDPNGDGFFGFGGPAEFYNGDSIRSMVVNKFNCAIQQFGRAEILVAPNIGRDTVASCGPFTLPNGSTINTSQQVSLKVGTSVITGCDSTILNYIYIPQIVGDFDLRVCRQQSDEVAFVVTTSSLLADDTLTYIWKLDGVEITDADNQDEVLTLNKVKGIYSLEIYSQFRGIKCLIYSNSVEYLGIDLGPSKPAVSVSDTILCAGENLLIALVKSDLAEGFIWEIPSVAVIRFMSPNRDSIVLDFAGAGDTTVSLKVAARNGCDTTEFVLSQFIRKIKEPLLDFNLEENACISSDIKVNVTNLPPNGFSYSWILPGATLVEGSLGQYANLLLNYTSEGTKIISLTASNAICGDTSITDSIAIHNVPVYITPTCRSDANSIIISWLGQDCIDEYQVKANGKILGLTDSIAYIYDGLDPKTAVDFVITGINSCGCDSISFFATCSTIDCAAIDLESSISDSTLCEGEVAMVVIDAQIPGFYPGGKLSFEGEQIDSLGNINASLLSVGAHEYSVNYLFEGCDVENKYTLMVRPKPLFTVEYDDIICVGESLTTYTITSKAADQLSFTIDGINAPASGFISGGSAHTFEGTDFAGCRNAFGIDIITQKPDGFVIEGNTSIFDNQILELYIKAVGNAMLDSAIWLVNGENKCKTSACLELINFNLDPGIYNHDITIFLNGCSTDTTFAVEVLPAFNLFIPNAFSPDALMFENQEFSLVTNEFNGSIKSFRIYDRWGALVYHQSTDISSRWAWDGTRTGTPVVKGVYVYMVEYEDEQGILRRKVGDVTIY